MATSKKPHGGKRPGAGRPPAVGIRLVTRVEAATLERIKARRKRTLDERNRYVRAKTAGEVIDDAVAMTEILD